MNNFNYNMNFISYGVKYDEDKFAQVKNKGIFNDLNLPPTKPRIGGFWGCRHIKNEIYHSEWQKFMHEKLYLPYHQDKINSLSTVFSIKPMAKVFVINSIDDIICKMPNGEKEGEPYLSLKFCKVAKNIPLECEKNLYLDFEELAQIYDAIYISSEAITNINNIITHYDSLIQKGEREMSIKECCIYMKAVIFEDWHVESLLIFNKEIIHVKEFIKV